MVRSSAGKGGGNRLPLDPEGLRTVNTRVRRTLPTLYPRFPADGSSTFLHWVVARSHFATEQSVFQSLVLSCGGWPRYSRWSSARSLRSVSEVSRCRLDD